MSEDMNESVSITARSGDEVYRELLESIFACGEPKAPRGLKTLELRPPTQVTILDPSQSIIANPARKLNRAFGIAEFSWVMAGVDEVETLAFYNENMRRFADWTGPTTWPWPQQFDYDSQSYVYPTRFFGAYGPPIRNQLPYVIEKLKSDPDTRQAVLTIWRPNPAPTKDVPCTVALQFMFWKGKLELVTYMRSNDVWLGFPYDIQMFTRVQSWVAQVLGVETGPYHHVVGSMHMYETNFADARGLLAAELSRPVESLPRFLDLSVDWKEMFFELGKIANLGSGAVGSSRLYAMAGYDSMLRTAVDFADRKHARRTRA